MLDAAAFADFRSFIKKTISYAKYKVGGTYYKTYLSAIEILSDGTVRAQLNINSGSSTITVTQVCLYNSINELWAHQDCSISITPNQTGALVWFDFRITEVTT